MNVEDTIRREQFCQIKDEILRSDDYLVVGIDVAKDKHHAFMGSTTGKSLVRKLVFENNLQVKKNRDGHEYMHFYIVIR